MRAADLLHFCFQALWRNRFRSLMLLFSMSIGVGSVVILTGLGEGARQYVLGEFASLGKDVLVVLPGRKETTGGLPPLTGSAARDLTVEDALAIARLPGVARVAPMVVGTAEVAAGAYSRESVVVGTTNEFFDIRRVAIGAGRALPPGATDRAAVAIVGRNAVEDLFRGRRALGGKVRIANYRYRVIGVLGESGGAFGMNLSDTVVVPVASALSLFNIESLFRVIVEIRANADLDRVRERILTLMTARHDGEPDVTVISPDSLLSSFNDILVTLTLVVASIGGISLVVAGVLIMNVSLISVSQRTREIGLLKALGTTSTWIRVVFLTEAAMMAAAGALLGVTVGQAAMFAARRMYPQIAFGAPAWSIAAAVAIAVGTGLVFAWLPAGRASRLEPVKALTGR